MLFLLAALYSLSLQGILTSVEVATTQRERDKGLMGRSSLGENEGMLFVFSEEQPLCFWMKNVSFPLSIGFFSREKKLLQVLDMAVVPPHKKPPLYCSALPAKYALEMPLGWFSKHHIQLGAEFTLHNQDNPLQSKP